MKRFNLRVAREEETPADEEVKKEEENEVVDDTAADAGGEDTGEADTPPQEPTGEEESTEEPNTSSDDVSERIRARQEARTRAKAANDQSTEYAQTQTEEEETRTNPEDTSNVDAAIAEAAAKVNPSPETVEDAAEKRRYAELVNNRAEAENATGEGGEIDPLMSEGEQEARTDEAEAEVSADEAGLDTTDVDVDTIDEEMSDVEADIDDSTEDVEAVSEEVTAVEAFVEMAQDALLGNGISPLAAKIGTRLIAGLHDKAGLGPLVTTGMSQESFFDNRRAATESIVDKAKDAISKALKRIMQWVRDLRVWLGKAFKAFIAGVDKSNDELETLYKYYTSNHNKLAFTGQIVNIAVVSQLELTVTSKNRKPAEAIIGTATLLQGLFNDLNTSSGYSLAHWSRQIKVEGAGSFEFSSLPDLIPRVMRNNVQRHGDWSIYTTPEMVGNRYLVATLPTSLSGNALTRADVSGSSMNLEVAGEPIIQQLVVERSGGSIDKLFSACFKLRDITKIARVSLKRQELDMATLNRSIEHLGMEVNNYQLPEDAKDERRKLLANLSIQVMLSQKLFNAPVLKLCNYAVKVQRAAMYLTKKVVNHKDSTL